MLTALALDIRVVPVEPAANRVNWAGGDESVLDYVEYAAQCPLVIAPYEY